MQRVLIVDDNPDNLMLVELALKTRGYELHTAATLVDCMALIAAHDFHLAFLDVELPDGDGLDAAEVLRAQATPPTVIMLSANDDGEKLDRANRLGVDVYMVKPFSLPQVLKLADEHHQGQLKRRDMMRLIRR